MESFNARQVTRDIFPIPIFTAAADQRYMTGCKHPIVGQVGEVEPHILKFTR